jgi:hypothetical protein
MLSSTPPAGDARYSCFPRRPARHGIILGAALINALEINASRLINQIDYTVLAGAGIACANQL